MDQTEANQVGQALSLAAEAQEKLYHAREENKNLLEVLADLLAIARIKYGNLDPDANKIFERATTAISTAKAS